MSEQFFSNIEPLNATEPDEAKNVANSKSSMTTKDEVVTNKDIKSSKYTAITLIAESRYGKSRVFKANSSSGTVVIKTLKEKYANDAKCAELLKREYELTSALDGKYIRKAYSYEDIEGLGKCVVMEYIQGKTLWEHVRLGTVSEKQVKNILLEICDALTYMHKNNVLHCDLRPENVMITDDFHVKLIDIGTVDTEYETNKEILVKELEFVAPELIKGEDGDARSDVYSVGKIMEFMYSRNMIKQLIDVSTPCTQYAKEQRYESVAELKSALSSRRSSVRVMVVCLVILLVAAAFYGLGKVFGEKFAKEDKEREEATFNTAIEEMKGDIPMLCEKYAIKEITDPLRPDWAEDSLRLTQKINMAELPLDRKNKAEVAMKEISDAIYLNRKNVFDKMLLSEYEKAHDSVAMNLKKANPNPTAAEIEQNANKWFERQLENGNYTKKD